MNSSNECIVAAVKNPKCLFGVVLGPFLPCDDLFGWWSLRCGVWIVFLLAVVGNGIVLFVSITARSKLSMDVPKFLICNLACADFMMGAYLGILAILDASTLGMIFLKTHSFLILLSMPLT